MQRTTFTICAGLVVCAAQVFGQTGVDPLMLKNWSAPQRWAPPADGAARVQELRNRGGNPPNGLDEMAARAAVGTTASNQALPSQSLTFVAVNPCRLVDTRPGQPAAIGGPAMGGGTSRTFALASKCGLPANAVAYSLNFTVVPASTLLFLTAWPTGTAQPNASTVNAPQGGIVANAAIVPAGTSGSIDVFVWNTTDVIIDVNGYFELQPGTKLLAGTVLSSGANQVLPAGATSTKTATGTYKITFATGTFGGQTPIPVAMQLLTGGVATLVPDPPTFSSDANGDIVTFFWRNPSNNQLTDTSFNFVLVQN